MINILIPVLLGILVGLITNGSSGYRDLIKPDFAPPGIIFPIMWFILYTLMGISIYLVKESGSPFKDKSVSIYIIQLVVNYLWSFIFFVFNLQLLSFFWIILLIVLVGIMIVRFFWINNLSAYLQVPYLLFYWYIFFFFFFHLKKMIFFFY